MICDSVYRHFKGNEYRVIAIARSLRWFRFVSKQRFVIYVPSRINADLIWRIPDPVAKHSETGQIFLMERVEDDVFLRPTQMEGETLAWVRPIENFLEILHSGTGEQVTNYARFQLINGVAIQ